MIKAFFCGKGLLWHLRRIKFIPNNLELENKTVNKNISVKPEDIIILIDGTRTRGMVPKAVSNGYYKNNEELDFKSVYSIKGIIIHADNIDNAIKEYKDIVNNLLED